MRPKIGLLWKNECQEQTATAIFIIRLQMYCFILIPAFLFPKISNFPALPALFFESIYGFHFAFFGEQRRRMYDKLPIYCKTDSEGIAYL